VLHFFDERGEVLKFLTQKPAVVAVWETEVVSHWSGRLESEYVGGGEQGADLEEDLGRE
jgi:hypothetical protein